jgi:hypothetical protein
MFTKNTIMILVVACSTLVGCGTLERTPVMTVQEADNYQVNCNMKHEQLEFLSRYVASNKKTVYQADAFAQAVIKRKINYLHSWCK